MKFMNINTILSVALLLMSANVFSASASAENPFDYGESGLGSGEKPRVWSSYEKFKEEYRSLKAAAAEGNNQAAFDLAMIFLCGGQVLMGDKDPMKVKTDLVKAASYLRQAADAEYVPAAINLTVLYSRCLIEDKGGEALKYYKASAEAGDKISQYNFAVCLFNGPDIGQNKVEYLKWMERAARQNYEPAKEVMKQISAIELHGAAMCCHLGAGVPVDESQAIVFLKLAAAQGYKRSKEELARLGIA
jgi:TPR repeat protein